MLLNLTVDNTFSQIGVILSLLVSAIIGLIPMVLDKSDYIQNSAVKNLSHKQKLLYECVVVYGISWSGNFYYGSGFQCHWGWSA